MGGVSETIDRHEGRLERIEEVLRAIVREARVEKLTFMAGSIAYHAFVSLLPALVLLYAVADPLGIDPRSAESGIESLTSALLSQGVSDQIISDITSSDQTTGLSIVGLAVVLWGSLRIFRGLDTAFSDIYESEAANTFTDQLTDGILVLGTFAVAILAAVYVSSRFPVTGSGPVVAVVGGIATVVGLTVAFLPMYYVFPDADVSVAEVLPGVVVASVGLSLFASLFKIYISETGKADSQSFVAAVILLLTWLYFSSLVVLLGVAVNAVLSNRSRDVSIDPVVGGVARGERRTLADREELVAELEELADRLDADPDSFVAHIDGEEVSLHPPQAITLDTDPELGFGDGSVALELRWTPREE